MEKLKEKIERTKEIIEEEVFESNGGEPDTLIILENQLVIMEALQMILDRPITQGRNRKLI